MGRVSLDDDLQFAASTGHRAVRTALTSLSERSRRGEVSISAIVHASDGGEVATIAVPVVIESDAASVRPESAFSLTIRARTAAGAFPTFAGTLSVEERGSAVARVRLSGEYTVPLGAIGGAANTLALGSIAEDGLKHFFADLVAETNREVREESEEIYRDSWHQR